MLAPFESIGSFTIEVSVGRISFKGKLIPRGVPCIFRSLSWSMLWITRGHFIHFSDLKAIYYLTKKSSNTFCKKRGINSSTSCLKSGELVVILAPWSSGVRGVWMPAGSEWPWAPTSWGYPVDRGWEALQPSQHSHLGWSSCLSLGSSSISWGQEIG